MARCRARNIDVKSQLIRVVGGGDGFTVLEGAGAIVLTADAELVPLVNYVGGLPKPFTYATDGRIAQS